MASGEHVVVVHEILPTQANFAVLTRRPGGSTPAEGVNVWAFDAASIEYLDFLCSLEGYQAGGLTFTLIWSAASAITNVTRWEIGIRRLQEDLEDIDTSHTYDFNAVDATTATLSGEVIYSNVTFTEGADMDSWDDGEMAIVRVRRNASHANDTMAGDAELWTLIGRET